MPAGYVLSLFAFWSSAAFAVTDPPLSLVIQIDEVNGCGTGTAADEAKKLCGDYKNVKSFDGDTMVARAYKECLVFYETALRVQNTFCSYKNDAVFFKDTSSVQAQAAEVGKANLSEQAIAKDNTKVAAINKAYMAKVSELGKKFHDVYPIYLQRISRLSAYGQRDKLREATCLSSFAATNLDLTSSVPGYLRELLAAASFGNAQVTWEHMWPAIRENYAKLRAVKEEAEHNATLAEMRDLKMGAVMDDTIKAPGPDVDSRLPPTPVQGAMNGLAQEYLTKAIKTWVPKLPGPAASIIGGGVIVVYNYVTNKKILYPETAATFIGMLSPGWGMAANVMVAAWRTQNAIVAEYQEFTRTQLKDNLNMTAAQLVDAWGKKKSSDVCVKAAAMETACEKKRPTFKPLVGTGDNCAISLDIQRDMNRDDGGVK